MKNFYDPKDPPPVIGDEGSDYDSSSDRDGK